MVDMFPFPRIVGKTNEEQIAQLVDYLVQFKETLEFALNNITTENLSPELINKLNELGAGIQQSNNDREEEIAQLSGVKSGNNLTISDVIQSSQFKDALNKQMTIKVNYDTGHLEYGLPDEEGN